MSPCCLKTLIWNLKYSIWIHKSLFGLLLFLKGISVVFQQSGVQSCHWKKKNKFTFCSPGWPSVVDCISKTPYLWFLICRLHCVVIPASKCSIQDLLRKRFTSVLIPSPHGDTLAPAGTLQTWPSVILNVIIQYNSKGKSQVAQITVSHKSYAIQCISFLKNAETKCYMTKCKIFRPA